jgi:peptidoglycan/xylan/chitin deacetylase (PgdA/CDA1 family)
MTALLQPVKKAARRAGLRRQRIAAARMLTERKFLARFGRGQPVRQAGRVLCYHSVGTPEWGVNDVRPEQFRRHIELALREGFEFCAPNELGSEEGSRRLAVTFDDGLSSVAQNAAPILEHYGVPYTLFIVTDWAEGKSGFDRELFMDWREIERLAGRGAVIGSHSVTHPNFGRLAAEQARYELEESRRVIEARLGIRPTTFAIPMGLAKDWTDTAQEIAEAAGYEVYSQAENRHPRATAARSFVSRFDDDTVFRGLLLGRLDDWEEWA